MKQSLEASWAMSDSPVPLFTLSFNVICRYGFCYCLLYQVLGSAVVSGLWFCSFSYGYLGSIDSMVTTFLLTFSVVYQHGQFSLYGFGIFCFWFSQPLDNLYVLMDNLGSPLRSRPPCNSIFTFY